MPDLATTAQTCEIAIKTHTPHYSLSGTQKALRAQTCTTKHQLHLSISSIVSAFKIPKKSLNDEKCLIPSV